MNELSHNIRRITLVAVCSFLLMTLVFGYWQVVRAPALRAHPYNQQAQQRAESIKPGLIYTGDGELVLGVEEDDDGWQYSYPDSPSTGSDPRQQRPGDPAVPGGQNEPAGW